MRSHVPSLPAPLAPPPLLVPFTCTLVHTTCATVPLTSACQLASLYCVIITTTHAASAMQTTLYAAMMLRSTPERARLRNIGRCFGPSNTTASKIPTTVKYTAFAPIRKFNELRGNISLLPSSSEYVGVGGRLRRMNTRG